MDINMGNADRIIRTTLAIIFIGLYATNTVTGTLGVVILVIAGIFIITSLVGFCPAYKLLGLNTCPNEK